VVSAPRIVAVAPGSPAAHAGLEVGDVIVAMDGQAPRDIIQYRILADAADVSIDVERGGLQQAVTVPKRDGEPLGIEVHSALFDQVQTCDNHCEFCFIYQLPPGLRHSLYVKDDDYRLSFLYGNFTTLTRFTEADLERIVTERLSPLNVSIHATDPDVRAEMLRNRRGATSLRWLRALLDHGIEVHGQIVVCPGINDGHVLDDTMVGILDRYPELSTVCVVPLGVSKYSSERRMRAHTTDEASAVVECVEDWQGVFRSVLGRRLVFAADEYYLLAGRSFPDFDAYEGFPMHEDGIGMARTFEAEFDGSTDGTTGPRAGFFAWQEGRLDGTDFEPYRGPRGGDGARVALRPREGAPIAIITSEYGAKVLQPIVGRLGRDDVRVVTIDNQYFGGNIGVTGLLAGQDIERVLRREPSGHRYLLPDVCLSAGRFLDGLSYTDLPHAVEIVPTDGAALRRALAVSDVDVLA
jgi:putative radical SAM enzyme (TIGR03279 family)